MPAIANNIYEHDKFHAQLSWAWKNITSGQGLVNYPFYPWHVEPGFVFFWKCCRSWSSGFWWSQLIRIYTIFHWVKIHALIRLEFYSYQKVKNWGGVLYIEIFSMTSVHVMAKDTGLTSYRGMCQNFLHCYCLHTLFCFLSGLWLVVWTLMHAGLFMCFFVIPDLFFKSFFFIEFFQEYWQSVKEYESKSGLKFCGPHLGPNCM